MSSGSTRSRKFSAYSTINWTGDHCISGWFDFDTHIKKFKQVIYFAEQKNYNNLKNVLSSSDRLCLSTGLMIICLSELIGNEYGHMCHPNNSDSDCKSLFIGKYSDKCQMDATKTLNIIKLLFEHYLKTTNCTRIPMEILNHLCFDDTYCHHLPLQYYRRCVYTKYLIRNYCLTKLLPVSNHPYDTIYNFVSKRVSVYLDKSINEIAEFYLNENVHLNGYNDDDGKGCVYHSLFCKSDLFIDKHMENFEFNKLHSFQILSDTLSSYPFFFDSIFPYFDEFISMKIYPFSKPEEMERYNGLIRGHPDYPFLYEYSPHRSGTAEEIFYGDSYLDADDGQEYKIKWNESPYKELMRLRVWYYIYNDINKCSCNGSISNIDKSNGNLIEYVYNQLIDFIIQSRMRYLMTEDGIECLYEYIDNIIKDIMITIDERGCEFEIGTIIASYAIGDFRSCS